MWCLWSSRYICHRKTDVRGCVWGQVWHIALSNFRWPLLFPRRFERTVLVMKKVQQNRCLYQRGRGTPTVNDWFRFFILLPAWTVKNQFTWPGANCTNKPVRQTTSKVAIAERSPLCYRICHLAVWPWCACLWLSSPQRNWVCIWMINIVLPASAAQVYLLKKGEKKKHLKKTRLSAGDKIRRSNYYLEVWLLNRSLLTSIYCLHHSSVSVTNWVRDE